MEGGINLKRGRGMAQRGGGSDSRQKNAITFQKERGGLGIVSG